MVKAWHAVPTRTDEKMICALIASLNRLMMILLGTSWTGFLLTTEVIASKLRVPIAFRQ
jgi:hypothetical protein